MVLAFILEPFKAFNFFDSSLVSSNSLNWSVQVLFLADSIDSLSESPSLLAVHSPWLLFGSFYAAHHNLYSSLVTADSASYSLPRYLKKRPGKSDCSP